MMWALIKIFTGDSDENDILDPENLLDITVYTANFIQTSSLVSEVQQKLIKFHQNEEILSNQWFYQLLDGIKLQFENLARNHENFNKINANDQTQLLESNTPIYVQYLLGKFINYVIQNLKKFRINHGSFSP